MTFTLGEVLSITTGKLLCPVGRLYAILNHMNEGWSGNGMRPARKEIATTAKHR